MHLDTAVYNSLRCPISGKTTCNGNKPQNGLQVVKRPSERIAAGVDVASDHEEVRLNDG
jgi:hypothetical protein